MSKLEIMHANITDIKVDYKQVDQKLEKILCESFEIWKENIMLKKKLENVTSHSEDAIDDIEQLEN